MEQRVIEAEERAEEAEDKVSLKSFYYKTHLKKRMPLYVCKPVINQRRCDCGLKNLFVNQPQFSL